MKKLSKYVYPIVLVSVISFALIGKPNLTFFKKLTQGNFKSVYHLSYKPIQTIAINDNGDLQYDFVDLDGSSLTKSTEKAQKKFRNFREINFITANTDSSQLEFVASDNKNKPSMMKFFISDAGWLLIKEKNEDKKLIRVNYEAILADPASFANELGKNGIPNIPIKSFKKLKSIKVKGKKFITIEVIPDACESSYFPYCKVVSVALQSLDKNNRSRDVFLYEIDLKPPYVAALEGDSAPSCDPLRQSVQLPETPVCYCAYCEAWNTENDWGSGYWSPPKPYERINGDFVDQQDCQNECNKVLVGCKSSSGLRCSAMGGPTNYVDAAKLPPMKCPDNCTETGRYQNGSVIDIEKGPMTCNLEESVFCAKRSSSSQSSSKSSSSSSPNNSSSSSKPSSSSSPNNSSSSSKPSSSSSPNNSSSSSNPNNPSSSSSSSSSSRPISSSSSSNSTNSSS